MRRRQHFAAMNPRDNRAPVPSGAGMGAAAVDGPSPVSRAEEEAKALIWHLPVEETLTPATDPTAAPLVRKRGRPRKR